jgi:VanZ family protein
LLLLKRNKWYAVLWLLLTIVLLCLPGKSLPDTSGDWFSRMYADKWIHIFLFAILVFLWCNSIPANSTNSNLFILPWLIIVVSGVIYGIAMELIQLWVINGRGFEGWDIAADAAGCVLGYAVALGRVQKK